MVKNCFIDLNRIYISYHKNNKIRNSKSIFVINCQLYFQTGNIQSLQVKYFDTNPISTRIKSFITCKGISEKFCKILASFTTMVASSGQKKETAIKLNSEINTIGLKQNENSNKTFYRHLPDLTMNAISRSPQSQRIFL